MTGLMHQALAGLASGAIYASLALALVVVHKATGHINLAQGEMATLSTYVAWSLLVAGWPFGIAFPVTIALAFVSGMFVERLVVRPMAHASPLSSMVLLIGLFVIINSLVGWFFTYEVRSFPSPFPSRPLLASGLMSTHELGTIAVTLSMLVPLFLFFRYTRLGLAMRAAAANPTSSRLVGIRVGLMWSLGWGLAAAIGAVAGMLIAPVVFLDPNMMSGVLIYAFAAALLGGIDSPWGTILGGFALGVIENLAGAYLIGTELKLSVALAVIVLMLVVRPRGLFGQASLGRV
jgi:branched-chain amino acid transport system permease protein